MNHTVTVVAYTHLPEALPNVAICSVNKRQSRFARLWAFRKALAKSVFDADAIIAINGASVELPLLTIKRPKTILCLADKSARSRAGFIESLMASRASAMISNIPDSKPEILPLEPQPIEALAQWEQSWTEHLRCLMKILEYGT
jgi:hypothetical protein